MVASSELEAALERYRLQRRRRAVSLIKWFLCLVAALFVLPLGMLMLGQKGAALLALFSVLLCFAGMAIYILATSSPFHRRYAVFCSRCGVDLDKPYGQFAYGVGPFIFDRTICPRCGAKVAA